LLILYSLRYYPGGELDIIYAIMMSLSCDYPVSWGSGFQDPASDWLICLIDLHDQIVFYLIIIASLVIWFTITSIWGGTGHLNLLQHGNSLELIWTLYFQEFL
jgi:Cytochrome C oxidase subunit II, transmembrane domain